MNNRNKVSENLFESERTLLLLRSSGVDQRLLVIQKDDLCWGIDLTIGGQYAYLTPPPRTNFV